MRTISFAVLSLGVAAVVAAQAPIPAAERRAVVETLAERLHEDFVFPDIGDRYAALLRKKLAAGAYDDIADPKAFAERLTADLQAEYKEGHLRVAPPGQSLLAPRSPTAAGAAPRGVEDARWIADGVAYIRFNMFPGDPANVDRVRHFMETHATARTLIIDARPHRGGGLQEMNVMLPYLYARPTPLVQMDTRAAVAAAGRAPTATGPMLRAVAAPPTIVRREHHVVPGKATPLRTARVFYLTSKRTASAAEHLALALKRTRRATLIGETTRGAGHYGSFADLGGGYSAFVPVGRTFDPATGKGWEATGVTPDVAVPADKALEEALKRAAG
ncbi:S41 family peptidase [Sphingoaurantiacus capsulatus]|uniref:S41 family peptidase n=1 Tax=Sphingoaurantiacus capsulatus TaxID=1771310 RepID=A0ABV7X977_9SPHN